MSRGGIEINIFVYRIVPASGGNRIMFPQVKWVALLILSTLAYCSVYGERDLFGIS